VAGEWWYSGNPWQRSGDLTITRLRWRDRHARRQRAQLQRGLAVGRARAGAVHAELAQALQRPQR
jgi:hypothetical protein